MTLSAAEKIRAIQEKADQEIAALRQEAARELAKKLSEAKDVVKKLEEEYEAVTGKPVRDKNIDSQPLHNGTAGRAKRLSTQEIAELTAKIRTIIKGCRTGVGIKEIKTHLRTEGLEVAKSQVVKALKSIEGLTSSGQRAATIYFVK